VLLMACSKVRSASGSLWQLNGGWSIY
jgi:hypothetical protein